MTSTLPTEASRTLQVDDVTFEYRVLPLADYVDDGLLLALGHFAQEIGLPVAFRHWVQIRQKQIRYDPLDKLLTFFISLVDGCGYTSEIDQKLKPYPVLAQAWALPEFAGQNAVNDTLHLLTWEHVQEIEQVFQWVFRRQSFALQQSHQDMLVVDIDAKGLPVSPRSHRFEWAERGYFPKRRNAKGLQFSAAFIGANFREVLGGHLAPGYAHLAHGLPAILHLVEKRLGTPLRRSDLLYQHAHLLQAEAKLQHERARQCEQHIQQGYVHLQLLNHRLAQHQAQIQALRARFLRLPQRKRKLQRQVATHQEKARRDRRRAKADRHHIEHLQARARTAHQEADLLREARQTLLQLAETLVESTDVRLILLRADSGLGSGEIITSLLERGYLFVVKGRDARTARNLAAQIEPHEWQRADEQVRTAEAKSRRVHDCPFDVRLVVCERTDERKRVSHYFLVTNLPLAQYGTLELVKFYNARQTIEAFNKVIGNVLWLTHLRTGSISANEAVAQLAMLAHDFLSWAAHQFFTGTPHEDIAIRELVQKGLHVVARVSWPQPNRCLTEFSTESPYARAFIAGPQGPHGQLPLPLDASARRRVEKTD